MKLRVAFLSLKQPERWVVNEGKADQREGFRYKTSVMMEDGDPVTLKLTEELYAQLAGASPKFGNVYDVVFQPSRVLKNNSYGKPEELLEIKPVGFEFVATSFDTIPARNKPADTAKS